MNEGISLASRIYFGKIARAARFAQEQSAHDLKCRCGNAKLAKNVVCNACWFSASAELRKSFRFGSQPERRAATRTLLDFAIARKQ